MWYYCNDNRPHHKHRSHSFLIHFLFLDHDIKKNNENINFMITIFENNFMF